MDVVKTVTAADVASHPSICHGYDYEKIEALAKGKKEFDALDILYTKEVRLSDCLWCLGMLDMLTPREVDEGVSLFLGHLADYSRCFYGAERAIKAASCIGYKRSISDFEPEYRKRLLHDCYGNLLIAAESSREITGLRFQFANILRERSQFDEKVLALA